MWNSRPPEIGTINWHLQSKPQETPTQAHCSCHLLPNQNWVAPASTLLTHYFHLTATLLPDAEIQTHLQVHALNLSTKSILGAGALEQGIKQIEQTLLLKCLPQGMRVAQFVAAKH